ncbi:MAG: outer membrane protein transport protein [Burkholderiales bacterium]|nr:outer membrane protein transport protein [Burkholderiales bacterium]
MKKHLVSMLIAGGLFAPLAHATNGYFSHGYGMKSKGMAGVGIALPQDALAAATNPAGMVMVGDRIDFGLDWFRPSRSSQIIGNGFGPDASYGGNATSNFFIPEFGYNTMMGADSSLGVSVYGNGGMNTDYAVNPFGRFGALGTAGVNLEQLFIAPTWSRKLNANNAIGVSLNLAYQRFSAKGLKPTFQGASSSPANVSDNGTDSSTGYGLHIGWIGQVSSAVTLGATYQSKTKMGKFGKYSGLFAQQGSFDIPATYGVGVAVKAAPITTVAFDIQRIMYGDVPSIANPLSNLTVLGNPLGSNAGGGFGWQNMTVYKIGVTHDWSQNLTLRAGWSHNNQQIPNSQTFFNILAPGVVRDHATLGATWRLADKSELSVAYMHAFKTTVNGVNSIPPGNPPGYGGGNSNISLSEDSIGIAYGWNM